MAARPTIIFSAEQRALIQHVQSAKSGSRAATNAIAGAGKSTTIIGLAKARPDADFLSLTFNAQLRLEVKEAIAAAGLTNVEVHTYHSLAVKYYDRAAHTDEQLIRLLGGQPQSGHEGVIDDAEFDDEPQAPVPADEPASIRPFILVIDEVQDMTALYFDFVCRYLCDFRGGAAKHLVETALYLFGDVHQGIYEFKGASVEFLSTPEQAWGHPFDRFTLSETYRCAPAICRFINREFLEGEERLKSASQRPGEGLAKYRADRWHDETKCVSERVAEGVDELAHEVAMMITRSIAAGRSRASDYFLLAPSIKARYPYVRALHSIENALVASGVPVYYGMSDEGALNEAELAHKVVIASYHQSKGRERKIVLVFGADASYERGKTPHGCPSALYVALTRAKCALMLYHIAPYKPLSFRPIAGVIPPREALPERIRAPQVAATDLTKWLSTAQLRALIPLVDAVFEREYEAAESVAGLKTHVHVGHGGLTLVENISMINGLVIPEHFAGRSLEDVAAAIHCDRKLLKDARDRALRDGNRALLGLVQWTAEHGQHHRLRVLSGAPNWLPESVLEATSALLRARVGANTSDAPSIQFEVELANDRGIGARADIISDGILWEIKCTADLQIEYKLQTAIYALLSGLPARLLNALTGEQWRVRDGDAVMEQLEEILRVLRS
jgi:hypothetical protein